MDTETLLFTFLGALIGVVIVGGVRIESALEKVASQIASLTELVRQIEDYAAAADLERVRRRGPEYPLLDERLGGTPEQLPQKGSVVRSVTVEVSKDGESWRVLEPHPSDLIGAQAIVDRRPDNDWLQRRAYEESCHHVKAVIVTDTDSTYTIGPRWTAQVKNPDDGANP